MRHWVTGITYTMNKIKIGVRGNKIKITLHAFAARTHSHIIRVLVQHIIRKNQKGK
jgi:hypothetical protein